MLLGAADSSTPGPGKLDCAVVPAIFCSSVVEESINPADIIDSPVSYTHLDVYKRQIWKRENTGITFLFLHSGV